MLQLGFKTFLEDDERIKKVFRTPFYFAFPVIAIRAALWGGLTLALWFFYPKYDYTDLSWLWQATLLMGLLHCFWYFFKWYVNGVLLTSESIILVDWPRFFERRSTRIDFHNLDEITVEKVGVRAFMLNYGNLMFAKVNGGDSFVVHKIFRPNRAARIIESYREWVIDQKNFTEESALKGLLSNLVQRHHGNENESTEHHWFRSVKHHELKADQVPTETHSVESEPIQVRQTVVDNMVPTVIPKASLAQQKHRVRQLQSRGEHEKQFDDEGGVNINL